MDIALLDIIVAAAIALFGFAGWVTGFVVQLFGVVALIAAWFLAQPLGRVIAAFLQKNSSMDEISALAFGTLAAGVLVFSIVQVICYLFNSYFLKRENAPQLLNRLIGGCFGAAKAFVIAWLLLGIVAALPQQFNNKKPNLYKMLQESRIRQAVEFWNPAQETGFVKHIRR